MDRSPAPSHRMALAAALGLVAVLGAGCGRHPGPVETAPRDDEVTGVATNCMDWDRDRYPAGQGMRTSAADLGRFSCLRPFRAPLPDGPLVAVAVGGDRGELSARRHGATVTVTVARPGPGCVTTMDWRGDLVWVGDDADLDPADLVVVERALPC